MHAIKLLPKGRITLPQEIRKSLGIKEGDILLIEKKREEIVIKKGKTIFDYIGKLPNKDLSIEQIIEKAQV